MNDTSKHQADKTDQLQDALAVSLDERQAIAEERKRLSRVIRSLTHTLTLVILLVLPSGFFIFVHGSFTKTAELDARRMGQELAQFITLHGDLWYFQEHRLEEIFHKQERLVGTAEKMENYLIFGPSGESIVRTDKALEWPVEEYEWPVKRGSQILGKMVLQKSLRDLMAEVAVVAVFGMFLSGLIYLTVLRLPSRILDSAFDRLAGSEAKLQKTNTELAEAVLKAEIANSAKSRFLAMMSHDLRTPLNAILGFSEVISHRHLGQDDVKYQEYAKDIYTSGKYLLTLINDILELSTVEAGKQPMTKENLPTIDVLKECESFIKEKVKSKGIDLVTEASKNLPPLYADRRAIMQILLNLLSNALRFTPEGGRIELKVTATNQHHTIEVSDTGMGISADRLATITEPFAKGETDPHLAHESTGLGLAIVKSLVELHGGNLDIKSSVGRGTTVTVTLPAGAVTTEIFEAK